MKRYVMLAVVLLLSCGFFAHVSGQSAESNQTWYRVVSVDKAKKVITVNEQTCEMSARGASEVLVCRDNETSHSIKVTPKTSITRKNNANRTVRGSFGNLEEGSKILCQFDVKTFNAKSIFIDNKKLFATEGP